MSGLHQIGAGSANGFARCGRLGKVARRPLLGKRSGFLMGWRRGRWLAAVWLGLACALLGAPGFVGGAGAAVLVEDGQNRTTVVISEENLRHVSRAPLIRQAVDELVHYIEKISGARPPVVRRAEDVQTPVTIWVGEHPGLTERFPDVDMELANWEQVVMACRGDHILLMGRDGDSRHAEVRHPHEAGTSLAVYEFIERHLGVRWLWPGELGEDVPQRATIEVEEFTHRHSPLIQRYILRFRTMSRDAAASFDFYDFGDLSVEDVARITRGLDDQAYDWHRRHRNFTRGYRVIFTGQHAFNNWYDQFGEEHPEYFALQPDGTRTPFPAPSRAKLCISNPAVAERWADIWEERLRRNPSLVIANINAGDSSMSGVCMCENCRAWDVPGEPTYTMRWRGHSEVWPSLTDRYVKFWNLGSRLLRERLPDRPFYVASLSYGPYSAPPAERRLEDNVTIGFVGSMGVARSPGAQERDRRYWEGWAEQAQHMTWRPNIFHGLAGTPALFARRLGDNFRFMAERKFVGINVDTMANHWATQGLQYYVLAKLTWDPLADVEEILDDYMARAFGEAAAEPMKRFLEATEEAYFALQKVEEEGGWHAMIHALPDHYSEEHLAAQGELLAQARAAAEGVHRDRIDFMQVGLDFTATQAEAVKAMADLRLGRGDIHETVRRAVAATERRDNILRDQLDSFTLNTARYYGTGYRRPRGIQSLLGPVGEEYRTLLDADRAEVVTLPTEWQFRLDPQGVGAAERWYEPERMAALEWGRMLVTAPWGEQLQVEDAYDPDARRTYHGVGWYRTQVELEELPKEGERIWLRFGAVDESCWVYVNGQQAGAQVYDSGVDRQAWRKPRRFDITGLVKQGTNEIAVKVQALAGAGGITRPVQMERLPANLVPEGDFAEGLKAPWRLTPQDEELAPHVAASEALSQYVGEKSLKIEISRNAPERGLYAQLRRVVAQPLQKGQNYEVIVRYMQEVDERALQAGDVPLRFRFGARRDAEREWHTAGSAPRSSADWERMSLLIAPEEDRTSFCLTFFFRAAGTFYLDEVIVRPAAVEQ